MKPKQKGGGDQFQVRLSLVLHEVNIINRYLFTNQLDPNPFPSIIPSVLQYNPQNPLCRLAAGVGRLADVVGPDDTAAEQAAAALAAYGGAGPLVAPA